MKYFVTFLFMLCTLNTIGHSNKHVSVKVTFAKNDDDVNHIIYGSRQLSLEDFQGIPNNKDSTVVANTTSGIAYKSAYSETGDIVEISITITVYFDKTMLWCKPRGRNEYILNHEQLHLDLTAIKACEMANEMYSAEYTKGNFNEMIANIYNKTQRQLVIEQNKYDNLTHHGILTDKQAEESIRIKALLQKASCFN